MKKLSTAAAALALVAGSTLHTAPLHAEDAQDRMDGTWENRSFRMDNEPGMGAVIEGGQIMMFVPPFMPGTDRMEMTMKILETDPDAEPAKLVYELIAANSPMIPITGEKVEASYYADEAELKLAINFTGGERPEDLEQRPGRWVLTCYKEAEASEGAEVDDGIDPALAGTWTGYLPMVLVIEDGMSYTKTPSGDVLSEAEVISVDESVKPMRMEAVITQAVEMPSLVGTTIRYLVEERGDRMRVAQYDFRSPKKGQWPRDFKGKKGDMLMTTVWQRTEAE